MFELSIENDNRILVRENGKEHSIPMALSYWNTNDLLLHWAYETYELLDGYGLKFLFTGMIQPQSLDYVRAFRVVRTRNYIHFDDVLIQSPWRVNSWNPKDIIDYLSSSSFQIVYDYQFGLEGRLPEFTISVEELEKWHHGKLEASIPEGYRSEYELSSNAKSI